MGLRRRTRAFLPARCQQCSDNESCAVHSPPVPARSRSGRPQPTKPLPDGETGRFAHHKDRTVNGTFASFAVVQERSLLAVVRSFRRANAESPHRRPHRQASKNGSRENLDRCTGRILRPPRRPLLPITFPCVQRDRAREDHGTGSEPTCCLALMNVDHGHVFGRFLAFYPFAG